MSRVRFLIFLGKEGQNVGGRGHLKGADILTGCAGTISRASTAETPPTFPAANIFCRPPTFQLLPYYCLIL